MPMNIQPRGKPKGSTHQLRVIHKNIPYDKPFVKTFATYEEAARIGNYLLAALDKGVVPVELMARKPAREDDPVMSVLISQYEREADPSNASLDILKMVKQEVLTLRYTEVTYPWAKEYVQRLKLEQNLAPSTIRNRVGALSRVIDWHIAETSHGKSEIRANPLKFLPKGYSRYTRGEARHLESVGLQAKENVERDRRLPKDEEEKVIAVLSGQVKGEGQRPMPYDPDFEMLFHFIVDTGMRLREAYWQKIEQIDFGRRTIMVDGTKGKRGKIKPREVPIKKELMPRLKEYIGPRKKGLLFPFWNGDMDRKVLANLTSHLSDRFKVLFRQAGIEDMREHDLRHEATCRWFELRNPQGHWVFSEMEIRKIMGWSTSPSGSKMAARYASLRGEDLAARMDF